MKKAGLAFAVAAWARESELIPSRLPFSDTSFKTASSSSGFTAFIYSSCTGFIESTHRSKSKTRTGPFINSCYWEMMLEMWMGSRCWPAMLENSFNLVEIDEKDSRLVRPEETHKAWGCVVQDDEIISRSQWFILRLGMTCGTSPVNLSQSMR